MRADNKDNLIIAVAGMVPVTWLALKLTPYSREPLVDIISKLDEIFAQPFHIEWSLDSL